MAAAAAMLAAAVAMVAAAAIIVIIVTAAAVAMVAAVAAVLRPAAPRLRLLAALRPRAAVALRLLPRAARALPRAALVPLRLLLLPRLSRPLRRPRRRRSRLNVIELSDCSPVSGSNLTELFRSQPLVDSGLRTALRSRLKATVEAGFPPSQRGVRLYSLVDDLRMRLTPAVVAMPGSDGHGG